MDEKTIFQKIIDKEIPATIQFEDDQCIVIEDINPQAPVHLLVISKKPITRLSSAQESDQSLLGHMLLIAQKVAKENKIENGFRLVVNNGATAGETVPHLHLHVMGSRSFHWPPG